MQPNELEELQKLIGKLDGVISTKLNANENGELCEIHVLAEKGRAPKQLSRDIQSAVAAFTGRDVEHRIISIAQIDNGVLPGRTQDRLKISNIETSSTSKNFSAAVTLMNQSGTYKGGSAGANTPYSRYKIIANACLNAVHEFLNSTPFSLSDIQKFRIANNDEINVAVCHLFGETNRLLTGTALVADDEYGAIIKATLDAVNRELTVEKNLNPDT